MAVISPSPTASIVFKFVISPVKFIFKLPNEDTSPLFVKSLPSNFNNSLPYNSEFSLFLKLLFPFISVFPLLAIIELFSKLLASNFKFFPINSYSFL